MFADVGTAAIGSAATLVFMVALIATRTLDVAKAVITIAQSAGAVLQDPDADDDIREAAMQKAALRLFGALVQIIFRLTITFAASAAVIYAAAFTGFRPVEDVIAWLARWDVILSLSVIISGVWLAMRRFWTIK